MSHSPVLTGPRLTLRPPRPEDAAARVALGDDAGIVRMFGGVVADLAPLTLERAEDWVAHLAVFEHAWVIEEAGRMIGSVFLHSVSQGDRRARLALGILDPGRHGIGLGREVIGLVLSHAFGSLGLHRVELRVLAYNEPAIRCYRACGFQVEGRERQTALVGGEWHDDMVMGILSHEFLQVSSV